MNPSQRQAQATVLTASLGAPQHGHRVGRMDSPCSLVSGRQCGDIWLSLRLRGLLTRSPGPELAARPVCPQARLCPPVPEGCGGSRCQGGGTGLGPCAGGTCPQAARGGGQDATRIARPLQALPVQS